jgi:hypothetical protein
MMIDISILSKALVIARVASKTANTGIRIKKWLK